jgi:hypothetical protein
MRNLRRPVFVAAPTIEEGLMNTNGAPPRRRRSDQERRELMDEFVREARRLYVDPVRVVEAMEIETTFLAAEGPIDEADDKGSATAWWK